MSGLVLALVGTDHHPFDRLVDWVDDAAVRHPELRFVIQHGTSKAPLVAEGHVFLTQDRLRSLFEQCSAVVCHGGPGTIMDARSAGHLPVCVPRDPLLGEHVDGHQQRFAGLVGTAGVVRTATTAAEFAASLQLTLATGRSRPGELDASGEAVLRARKLLADELDELVQRQRVAPLHLGPRRPRPGR